MLAWEGRKSERHGGESKRTGGRTEKGTYMGEETTGVPHPCKFLEGPHLYLLKCI